MGCVVSQAAGGPASYGDQCDGVHLQRCEETSGTEVWLFVSGPARDLWYNKLSQLIASEREQEAKMTAIHVVYRDPASNSDLTKTLTVGSTATARDCVRSALASLDLTAASAADYQLWARPAADEPPYPLIGHELPFAIQMHATREAPTEDRTEMDHCNNIYSSGPAAGCQFVLRPLRSDLRALSPSPDSAKKKKLSKKSPIRIHNVFRRTNSKPDSVDSAFSVSGAPLLFGQPLTRLCQNDTVPPPVLAMLVQLFRKGPYTVGIFRKSANARVVKEIKEKLDSGIDVDMESVNIYAVAGLAKDFLRSLPDPLLGSELYDEWRDVADIEDEHDKILRVRELCARLPAANVTLLCHFLCVLHHVARRSHHNLMSAANVAVCVGPSLLTPACPTQALATDGAKRLPAVVALMIERCDAIFGSECLRLLGPPPGRSARADSGEDSDGLASGGGVRRDDSSIDSLERELLGENEPLPRKDKMAATNLSRDSGLTLSDTQLYALDDEESASTSSGQSVEKSEHSACSSGRGSDNSYRHRPVDGSGIYASPRRPGAAEHARESPESIYARPPLRQTPSHFKRQDWTRQHHPVRRTGKPGFDPKSSLRRSASEESLVKMCGAREPPRPAPETADPRPSPARSPPMVRSRSAHHLAQRRDARLAPAPPLDVSPSPAAAWPRSRSTPHIDDADRSYDSSTLSDDDSTPHVSRSNSRSKDCTLANDLWERNYGTVDPRGDARFVRGSSVTSSRGGSCVETPPSYDVTVSRRQRAPAGGRNAIYALPEQVIREQTILSNRAKQLYEESLRIYAQQTSGPDMVYASPVRAVSGGGGGVPPPLPPKQRSPLRRPGSGRRQRTEQPAARTVIQIGDAESVPRAVRRPERRVSRREAETQTEADERGEEADERRRRPHVTLVEIEAAPRCPRPGDAAESWAEQDVGWSVSRLRELFSADGQSSEPPPYRHPPLRRAGGGGAGGAPGDIYAALPPPRLAPLGRTASAGSSNDGEESYV